MSSHPTLIPSGAATLEGDLVVPPAARGLVVFAHGSGSNRFSARNRYVAEHLRRSGLGTFLLDLLTTDEEAVDFRTRRLRFGASTGAAAALVAAARSGSGACRAGGHVHLHGTSPRGVAEGRPGWPRVTTT